MWDSHIFCLVLMIDESLYIHVRRCGGLSIVHLRIKSHLELLLVMSTSSIKDVSSSLDLLIFGHAVVIDESLYINLSFGGRLSIVRL